MWQIYVALSVVVGQIIQPTLNKKVADLGSLSRSLLWVYGFSALFCIAAYLIIGGSAQVPVWIILGLGVLDAFAQYGYWRVIASPMGLSRASVFGQGEDFVAVGLGYFILNEAAILTPSLAVGIGLVLASVLLFAWKNSSGQTGTVPLSTWVWIVFYGVVWGTIHFAIRALALDGVMPQDFLWLYYSGSFIGAVAVYHTVGRNMRGSPFSRRQVLNILLPAAAVLPTSVAIVFLAKMYAPIIVVQPIWGIAGVVLPAIIGLVWFKEWRLLGIKGAVGIVFGLAGAIVIALSY